MFKEKDIFLKFSEVPALKMLIMTILGLICGFNAYWTVNLILILLMTIIIISFGLFKIKMYLPVFLTISFSIGLVLSYNTQKKVPLSNNKISPEITALINAKVIAVMSEDGTYSRLLMEGQLEPKGFGEINNTRFILTVRKDKQKAIISGSQLQGSARIHPPMKKALPNTPDEVRISKLYDADWFARAASSEIAVIGNTSNIFNVRYKLSDYLWEVSGRLFSVGSRPILYALVSGDQTKIPADIRLAYSLSGTSHVLAVSGLHVGLISSFILMISAYFRQRGIKFIVFLILVSTYVFLTGSQPSAVRAGVFAVLIYYCYVRELKVNLVNVVSFGILMMLVFNPENVFSAGFLMSSASVIGISLLYKPMMTLIQKISNSKNERQGFVSSSIALTVSASIMVSPIVAYFFGIYSLVSVPANIIIVPLSSLALIFALIAFSIYPIFAPFSLLFANSADYLIFLANKINCLFLSIPLSALKSEIVFPISILISLGLIYLIFSKNRKALLFRFTVSGISIYLCVLLMPSGKSHQTFPLEHTVAEIVQLNKNTKLIYLADRKNSYKPFRNIYLERYIAEFDDSLYIGVSGLSSLSLCDEIKKSNKIRKIIPLDIGSQMKINKMLGHDNKFPQVINISD